jgi:hypothetical protein
MIVERQADAKDDRVRLTMTGNFFPLKDEGAQGNEQAYGFKEG